MFGDDANMYALEDVQMHDLGQIGEVVITKDDTLFMKVGYKNQETPITKFYYSGLDLSNLMIDLTNDPVLVLKKIVGVGL